MVSAGRILIMPKGPWSDSVTYSMLDAVYYGGNLFIAKRQNINVQPAENDDWMLSAEGATGVVVTSFNGRTGAVTPASGDYDLEDMGDTAISSPTNKQGLIFNGTSNKWENADIEGLPSNVITYAQFSQMSDAEQLAFTGYVTDYPGIDDEPVADDVIFDNTGTDLVSNNVNDAIVEVNDKVNSLHKIKYFNVVVPANSTSYNYTNDKPSDFKTPISAISIGGGTCVISQIGSSTMYFTTSLSSSVVVRILYDAN